MRSTRSPQLPVIHAGGQRRPARLLLALIGVGLSVATGNGIFDGIATLCIGALLVTVAVLLAVETKSLTTGESAVPDELTKIHTALLGTRIEVHPGTFA